jgi:branched-chain amino acid transport system ATP-binding protein
VTALLEAEGLQLAYGEISACRDVSLHVGQGEIVTLIGANGAGKSTTLRAVAGALLPRAGSIRFRGHDITRLPSYERTKLGISLVPEGRRVFPFLTVRENLELGAFKYRKESAKVRGLMDKVLDMFPRLRERRSQNAGTLSGGEQQMLALGRAIMSEPHLICLDEPSLGLAPMVVQDIFRTIKAINAAGTVSSWSSRTRAMRSRLRAAVTCCRRDRSSPAGPVRRCATMIACAKPISAVAQPSGWRFETRLL